MNRVFYTKTIFLQENRLVILFSFLYKDLCEIYFGKKMPEEEFID